MRALKLLITPDYSPEVYIDWRLFSYLLQDKLNRDVILLTAENHDEFEDIIRDKQPELIYSNPFDVIKLTEKFDYEAIAKPANKSDEIILFSSIYGSIKTLDDLPKPLPIISLPNKEIIRVSQLLLEASDFAPKDLEWVYVDHLPAVMRKVLGLDVPVGAIYADYFYHLSPSRQSEYHILIESKLEVIHHVFLSHLDNVDLKIDVQQAFMSMGLEQRMARVFYNLGWYHGLEKIDNHEGQFFLDILRTLHY